MFESFPPKMKPDVGLSSSCFITDSSHNYITQTYERKAGIPHSYIRKMKKGC